MGRGTIPAQKCVTTLSLLYNIGRFKKTAHRIENSLPIENKEIEGVGVVVKYLPRNEKRQ